jgi:molybdopterin/thiamine biosynthesis adenylyltransferase
VADNRFDRNIRFFGAEGQAKLGKLHVGVVGVGGLGTHVVQQLSLLGIGKLTVVDHEALSETNLNRYVGAFGADVGTPKVEIARRLAKFTNPAIIVNVVPAELRSIEAFEAVRACDLVVGCLDTDGARLVLTEVAGAAGKVYADLATDILPDAWAYGGRVVFSFIGSGCLVCRHVLDLDAARRELDPDGTVVENAIYGVPHDHLERAGPSVVSINGVVASLAVTEVMLHVTGLRPARVELTYRADTGSVRPNVDVPDSGCYLCEGIFGKWDDAGVAKYLRF